MPLPLEESHVHCDKHAAPNDFVCMCVLGREGALMEIKKSVAENMNNLASINYRLNLQARQCFGVLQLIHNFQIIGWLRRLHS